MKRLGFALTTLALVLMIVAPAMAKKDDKYIEKFEAVATSVQGGAGGMQILRFGIMEWTSAEDREAMVKAFGDGDNDALYDWLDKQPQKAVIITAQGRPYELMYAYEFKADGKRKVILATNRPISGLESLVGGQRSLRYKLSLVIIEFEEGKKKGTGQMLLGAELSYKKDTNTLTLEGLALQPIKFTKVTDKMK